MEASKFSNREIAKLLREIAAAYEVKGENRFKIRAYDTSADSVEHATSEVKDLWEERRLGGLPGVGASISQHLDEYFRTGKVKHFDEVKKGLPLGMFNILGFPGIGPKKAYRLAKELRVSTVGELREAAQDGKIAVLEGFGEESQKDILQALKERSQEKQRMLLPLAYSVAQKIIRALEKLPEVERADPLGSLRRMVSTVGDIDIGVATKSPQKVVEKFKNLPDVEEVLAAGGAKASVILKTGRQVDIRVHDPQSYGALLQYFTGSKQHNIHLRKIANEMGYTLSEYGVGKLKKGKKTGEVVPTRTEEEFYRLLGMDWIPPELREDTGEIEAALRTASGKPGGLPKLVELKDIKGDLHVHTTHSDGQLPSEVMVKKTVADGLEYVGISDHAPSVEARGKSGAEKILEKRRKEIENLRKKYPQIKILFGAEVNIDAEATLALPNDLLAKLDYAIGSIHTSFDQPREKITQRLLSAIESPYVRFIAHPTGRLLGEREAYEVDWEKVFEAAKKYHKILEINSFYSRLDLPDTLVREAKRWGIRFIINTDAHHSDHFANRLFGVSVARRGWCERKDILNTLPYEGFEKEFLK